MKLSLFILLLLSLQSPLATYADDANYAKQWRTLTEEEKNIFVSGVVSGLYAQCSTMSQSNNDIRQGAKCVGILLGESNAGTTVRSKLDAVYADDMYFAVNPSITVKIINELYSGLISEKEFSASIIFSQKSALRTRSAAE